MNVSHVTGQAVSFKAVHKGDTVCSTSGSSADKLLLMNFSLCSIPVVSSLTKIELCYLQYRGEGHSLEVSEMMSERKGF